MRCYNCGGFLYEGDTCNVCGADVSLYKSIVERSNQLYNRALECTKNRNLSRAIEYLEVALKLYKRNVNARNLLGLIYHETGEYTEALSQWVISKNLQPENNLANDFINSFQKNRSDLDKINSAIKKYNKALSYAEQGSYDLAEIQLKKLLNDNPGMVKGHQLLALLLIRKNKFAEARVALGKAARIDGGSPVTIAYQNHVNEEIKEEEKELSPMEIKAKRNAEKPDEEHSPLSGDDVIIPKSEYKEHNPMVMAIIQLIIGVVIGAAIIFFIVTPAKIQSSRAELDSVKTEYERQIDTLNAKLASTESSDDDSSSAKVSSAQSNNYTKMMQGLALIAAGDVNTGSGIINEVNPESIKDKDFKEAYEENVKEQLHTLSTELNQQAQDLLAAGDYAGAARQFVNSYYAYRTADNAEACYMAAVSFAAIGDNDTARIFYELYTADNPKGERAEECKNAVAAIDSGQAPNVEIPAQEAEAEAEPEQEEIQVQEETEAVEEIGEPEPIGYDEEGNPIYG